MTNLTKKIVVFIQLLSFGNNNNLYGRKLTLEKVSDVIAYAFVFLLSISIFRLHKTNFIASKFKILPYWYIS